MPSTRQVTTNTLAQAAAKICGAVLSLLITKWITGQGQAFYGAYKVAYDYLAFFGIIADMGLYTIAVREMTRTRDRSNHIIGNVLSVRLLLVLGVTVLAGGVAQLVPEYRGRIATGVWITGLSMMLTITAGTLSSVLQSRMKIYGFSGGFLLGKLFLAGAVWWLLTHSGAADSALFYQLLWAGVASNLLFCAVVAFSASRLVKIRLLWDFDWIKNTLKTSLPYGIALILQTLYLRLDMVLISILRGTSAAGVYGIAAALLENLRIVGVFFAQALLPKLTASAHEKNDHEPVRWATGWSLSLALPVVAGGWLYREKIVLLLSNSDFLSTAFAPFGAEVMLGILLFTLPFFVINQTLSTRLIARAEYAKLLPINAIALGLNAILNIIFLPKYGIIAAAVSTVLCEALVLIQLLFITENWKNMFPKRRLFAAIGATGVMSLIIYLTRVHEFLILGGLISVVVYCVAYSIMGGLRE